MNVGSEMFLVRQEVALPWLMVRCAEDVWSERVPQMNDGDDLMGGNGGGSAAVGGMVPLKAENFDMGSPSMGYRGAPCRIARRQRPEL